MNLGSFSTSHADVLRSVRQINQNWNNKAEAEVSAIKFARKIGIPAPDIVFWDEQHIIYKKIDGENLGKIWKSLSTRQKRNYMRQTIKFVEKMQKHPWPTKNIIL